MGDGPQILQMLWVLTKARAGTRSPVPTCQKMYHFNTHEILNGMVILTEVNTEMFRDVLRIIETLKDQRNFTNNTVLTEVNHLYSLNINLKLYAINLTPGRRRFG